MRRILATCSALLLTGATLLVASAGAEDSHTYRIEFDNAFGLVTGSEVRVAGVKAGQVTDLDINERKKAVITIEVSGPLSTFRESATCSSQPQSLIAEYYMDCQPGQEGDELPDDGLVPVHSAQYGDQTFTTVQTDLVQNTLREPFKERLALIFGEFGTALAGNPENLNAAIRRGAPALRSLREALEILARQNRIIRDLNVNSDQIISRLAERRADVVSFIENANRASQASAERRADLSENFRLLPGFLAELRPSLVRLGELADAQTPLLVDLDAAAGQLYRLTQTMPRFNDATVPAVESLGDAAEIGRSALSKGTDEIRALRQATRNSFSAAEQIANFLVDLDDPRRAVEVDARAAEDTGRPAPTGYTGLEGLLNYAYYQALAINQFDTIGHLLHFIIYEFEAGPCGEYHAEQNVPAAGGGTTTDPDSRDRCVSWLGPNQPQISQPLSVPPYDPSVCPQGSDAPDLCQPAGAARIESRSTAEQPGDAAEAGSGTAPGGPPPSGAPPPAAPILPGLPEIPGVDPGNLGQLLGIDNPQALQNLLNQLGQGGGLGQLGQLGQGGGGGGGGGGVLGALGQRTASPGSASANQDLLHFLFGN